MPKTSSKKFAQPWQVFVETWKKSYPPSRPSRGNILAYKKLLKEIMKRKNKVQVLLLGATPELRDMFSKYKKVKVTLVDINFIMIVAMVELMKNKKATQKENWICANWLETPLQKNYYDIVFGDFITGNIPRKDLPRLYQKIKSVLKPSGYFLQRLFSYYFGATLVNLEAFINHLSRKKITDKVISDLWTIGVFCCGCDKNKLVSTNYLFQKLKALAQKNKKIKELYQKAQKIIAKDKYWSYGYTGDEDEKLIEKYFTIEKYLPDTSHPTYKRFSRIYKLRKK